MPMDLRRIVTITMFKVDIVKRSTWCRRRDVEYDLSAILSSVTGLRGLGF